MWAAKVIVPLAADMNWSIVTIDHGNSIMSVLPKILNLKWKLFAGVFNSNMTSLIATEAGYGPAVVMIIHMLCLYIITTFPL